MLTFLGIISTSQIASFNFFGKCFTDTDCKEGKILTQDFQITQLNWTLSSKNKNKRNTLAFIPVQNLRKKILPSFAVRTKFSVPTAKLSKFSSVFHLFFGRAGFFGPPNKLNLPQKKKLFTPKIDDFYSQKNSIYPQIKILFHPNKFFSSHLKRVYIRRRICTNFFIRNSSKAVIAFSSHMWPPTNNTLSYLLVHQKLL